MEMPENVGFGKVVGRFTLAVATGPEEARFPRSKPASGKITFTPGPARLLNVTADPPVTIIPQPIVCTLDDEGHLIDPEGDRGVWLIATDDDDNNPVDWPYQVQIALEGITRWTFNMKVPEDATLDLTTVLPVADVTGRPMLRGEPGTPGPRGPRGPEGDASLKPKHTLTPALAPGATNMILLPTENHGWQIGGDTDGASLSLDTTRRGPFTEASFHLDSRTGKRVYMLNKTLTPPIDLNDGPIVVWVYLPQGAPAGVGVEIGIDASNKWIWTGARGAHDPDQAGYHINGWTAFEFFPSFALGSPPMDGLTYGRVLISGIGHHGYVGGVGQRMLPKTATGDLLYPNGVMSVFFDDGYMDIYTHALPVLARHGAYGIAPIIAELAEQDDNDLFMDVDILRRLQDQAGWEVSAHSFASAAHDNRYTSLDPDELETEFRELKAWLTTHGFDTSIWISPGGVFSRTIWETGSRYFSIHRGVAPSGSTGASVGALSASPRRVYPTSDAPSFFVPSTTKATMMEAIDNVKAAKSWGSIVFHHTKDGPSVESSIGVDDLDEIMAYAAAEGVPIRTVNQVMRSVE